MGKSSTIYKWTIPLNVSAWSLESTELMEGLIKWCIKDRVQWESEGQMVPLKAVLVGSKLMD